MGVVDTLRSMITTGLRLPFGVGVLGPSGIHGRTFARRIQSVRRLALRLARRHVDEAAADDIADDITVAVWERLGQNPTFLDGSRPLPPIIHGMVRKTLLYRARSARNQGSRDAKHLEDRSKSIHTWMDPEAHLTAAEMEEIHRRALARIGPTERYVLALSREEGLTYAEIAERCGRSVNTVRKQIVSALAVYREECLAWGLAAPAPQKAHPRSRRAEPQNDTLPAAESQPTGESR